MILSFGSTLSEQTRKVNCVLVNKGSYKFYETANQFKKKLYKKIQLIDKRKRGP